MAELRMKFQSRHVNENEVAVRVFEGEREVGSFVVSRAVWIKLGTALIISNAKVMNWHVEVGAIAVPVEAVVPTN